jgi:hypothetical protein
MEMARSFGKRYIAEAPGACIMPKSWQSIAHKATAPSSSSKEQRGVTFRDPGRVWSLRRGSRDFISFPLEEGFSNGKAHV